jgi:hypothetical protein
VVPAHDAPQMGLPVKWDSVMRENTTATNTEMQKSFFLNSQNLTSVFLMPLPKAQWQWNLRCKSQSYLQAPRCRFPKCQSSTRSTHALFSRSSGYLQMKEEEPQCTWSRLTTISFVFISSGKNHTPKLQRLTDPGEHYMECHHPS